MDRLQKLIWYCETEREKADEKDAYFRLHKDFKEANYFHGRYIAFDDLIEAIESFKNIENETGVSKSSSKHSVLHSVVNCLRSGLRKLKKLVFVSGTL